MYLHVDLCCGLGGWQAPFEASDEWRSVGVDIRRDVQPDVLGDVRQLPISASPDLLTMSPPCNEFSYWDMPWSDDVDPSLDLVKACIEAVDRLEPEYWILENVRGLHRYWRPADKRLGRSWYFWGDFPPWDAELQTKGMSSMAGRGLDDTDTEYDPDMPTGNEAARIPYHVADALRMAVETWTG